jgi:hypothetical protein
MARAAPAIEWLGSDRRPSAVAAALDQLANEANEPESRAALRRGAEAIRRGPGVRRRGGGRKCSADDAAVLAMELYNLNRRERGLVDNDREAARVVGRRLAVGGNSDKSIEDRLRKKLSKHRARLMALAAGTIA